MELIATAQALQQYDWISYMQYKTILYSIPSQKVMHAILILSLYLAIKCEHVLLVEYCTRKNDCKTSSLLLQMKSDGYLISDIFETVCVAFFTCSYTYKLFVRWLTLKK